MCSRDGSHDARMSSTGDADEAFGPSIDTVIASAGLDTFLLSEEDCRCIGCGSLELGELRVLPLRGGVWGYVIIN